MPDTRLRDVAQHILDTLVVQLADAGIEVPARRYPHSGQVAFDFAGERCAEAFIVSWIASFQEGIGATGAAVPVEAIRCAMPLFAQFEVTLLRCVPLPKSDGTPPSAEQLETSGLEIMVDSWTLASTVVESALDGTLKTTNMDSIGIGSLVAVGPQGGVGGTSMTLFVSIL